MDISRTRKQASFLNSIITKKKTGNYFWGVSAGPLGKGSMFIPCNYCMP